ncbi:MAG: sodium:proton antiporter [Candidatus Sumerlaeota bacterium]|nr:sodium:proton antiporter [Candidatus Sumerlaeota bacterium]
MIYFLCLVFFCVGLYGILVKRNLIKIIIGMSILDYSVNLFLVLTGYRMGGRAPIYDKTQEVKNMVDPIPQALVLTAIVIGLAVLALMIAIAVRLYEKYGTYDITEIRKLRG